MEQFNFKDLKTLKAPRRCQQGKCTHTATRQCAKCHKFFCEDHFDYATGLCTKDSEEAEGEYW